MDYIITISGVPVSSLYGLSFGDSHGIGLAFALAFTVILECSS